MSFQFEGTSVGLFVWETNGIGNTIQPGYAVTYIDDNTADQRGVDAWNRREEAGSACVLRSAGTQICMYSRTILLKAGYSFSTILRLESSALRSSSS